MLNLYVLGQSEGLLSFSYLHPLWYSWIKALWHIKMLLHTPENLGMWLYQCQPKGTFSTYQEGWSDHIWPKRDTPCCHATIPHRWNIWWGTLGMWSMIIYPCSGCESLFFNNFFFRTRLSCLLLYLLLSKATVQVGQQGYRFKLGWEIWVGGIWLVAHITLSLVDTSCTYLTSTTYTLNVELTIFFVCFYDFKFIKVFKIFVIEVVNSFTTSIFSNMFFKNYK